MAQVDLTTYFIVSIWMFVIFGVSFIFFISYFFPLFIFKVKSFMKLLNVSFFFYLWLLNLIIIFENSGVFSAVLIELKKLFK